MANLIPIGSSSYAGFVPQTQTTSQVSENVLVDAIFNGNVPAFEQLILSAALTQTQLDNAFDYIFKNDQAVSINAVFMSNTFLSRIEINKLKAADEEISLKLINLKAEQSSEIIRKERREEIEDDSNDWPDASHGDWVDRAMAMQMREQRQMFRHVKQYRTVEYDHYTERYYSLGSQIDRWSRKIEMIRKFIQIASQR